MKQSAEYTAKGTFHEMKGKIKEKVLQLMNMPYLAD